MRNYTIAAVFLGSFLIFSPALAFVEISDGSVKALYHLSDVVDSSGNGHTLTNHGSATFVPGKLGDAVELVASSSQYLSRSLISSSTDNFAVSMWVYVSSTNMGGAFFHNGKLPAASEDGWAFGVGDTDFTGSTGNNLLILRNGVAWNTPVGALGSVGWKHVVVERDAGTWKGYINDVLGTTSTGAPSTPTVDTTIGTNNDGVSVSYFNGKIDEVVFMTGRVFSTSEISALYNGGAGAEVCVTVGCGTATTTPSSTATTTLSASDAVLTYLLYILDAVWLAACLVFFWFAFRFMFGIKK